MGILTKIRQKPDHQKKMFSLVSALILTLIIVAAWYSFSNISVKTQLPADDKLSSVSPLQVIKDEFAKAFKIN